MKIDSAEVINELNLECECAREVLAAMQAQRDLARDLAIRLEADLSALQLIAHCALHMRSEAGHKYTEEEDGGAKDALYEFAIDGTISADTLALASRLSGGEG